MIVVMHKFHYKRFPGDTIVVPMVIGVLLNSFVPQFLEIGSFWAAMTKNGTAPLVGVFLFFIGASMNIRSTGRAVAKGTVIILTKIVLAVLLVFIAISHVKPKVFLKGMKPVVFIVIFTAILNLFYTSGHVLWSYGIFKITEEGLWKAGFMVLRILMLICCTLLLTYTTSPILLTDGLERLLRPLKRFGFPVHELSMMMSIALRFIPTLIQETDKIISAQKARGADFDSGNLIQKAKALIPILIPLFISSFRRAEELAIAMECRCYHGDEGRTSLRQLKMAPRDWVLIGFCVVMVAAVIALRILGL